MQYFISLCDLTWNFVIDNILMHFQSCQFLTTVVGYQQWQAKCRSHKEMSNHFFKFNTCWLKYLVKYNAIFKPNFDFRNFLLLSSQIYATPFYIFCHHNFRRMQNHRYSTNGKKLSMPICFLRMAEIIKFQVPRQSQRAATVEKTVPGLEFANRSHLS